MLNENKERKLVKREFPYSGVPTFYKYPHTQELQDVDVALVGVPLDQGTTNRSGTRMGPRAIREASQIYGSIIQLFKEAYDIEMERSILRDLKIIDYGDVPIVPTLTEVNRKLIREAIQKILENQVLPVAFGGDHSITFPIVQAYQEELDVVHFDSHLDFTDDYGEAGLKYTHGNPLKRISELENVDKITQIGIRGLLTPEFVHQEARKYGSNIITAGKALKHGMRWVLSQIPESENLYVTLDIDVLDPSVAPGTGTPEPGGFNYLQVKEILTRLPEKGNIVGFDIVEVNPLYDVGEMTSQVAARLALDFLGSIFHGLE